MRTDDDIEALLRMAGRRPAVPPDRSRRVRESVHGAWRRAVRLRRRRRILWIAGAVAACLVALLPWISPGSGALPPGSPGTLMVESLQGSAWLERPWRARTALTEGSVLAATSAVATGEDGRLSLRHEASVTVRLDTETRVVLLDDHMLRLDAGAVYVDSGGPPGSSAADVLAIRTPRGIIRAEGTQYEVRLLGASVRVSVREGAVLLDRGEGRTHRVTRAQRLTVGGGETGSVEPIAVHGAAWDWTAQVASVPDFAGQSARTFLEWVARERGLDLRFADETAARTAERARLGGSLGRLRLDEALDAVLPTCGLTHRVEGNVLLILGE